MTVEEYEMFLLEVALLTRIDMDSGPSYVEHTDELKETFIRWECRFVYHANGGYGVYDPHFDTIFGACNGPKSPMYLSSRILLGCLNLLR